MDIGTIIKEMLTPELLPLIVVLYLIGMALKNYQGIDSKHIPVILGVISLLANALYVFSTGNIQSGQEILGAILTIFMQGILFAGAAVYINQIYKQNSSAG